MGAVAAELSDAVIVTSDNPRSEDPDRIIDDIVAGLPAAASAAWTRDPDRGRAIAAAVAAARPDDVILIAGKGHERYQEIGARVLPFDDAAVARAALAERRAADRTKGAA